MLRVVRSGVRAIFRWLRCHLISVTVVAFAAAGYLLRDDLSQALSPIDVQVTYGLDGERGPIPVPAGSPRQPPLPTHGPSTAAAVPARVSGPAATPAPFASPAERENRTQFAAEPSGDERATELSRSLVPAVYQQASYSAEGFHFRPLDDASVAPGEMAVGGRQGDLLNQARRAYWNDEPDSAVSLYETLIQEFPHNPDYLGELGNVYFQQGNKALAAQAYFEAAVRLENQGERSRAERLQELLQKIDPAYATALDEHLDGSRGSSEKQ